MATADNERAAGADPRARELYAARRDRAPIAPLTDAEPELTLDDAYVIQQDLLELLLADGDHIVGYKLGLTSQAMQQMLGVDTPDFSAVVGSQQLPAGGEVELGRFIAPMVEAEIAFHLGAPLRGPGVTVDDVHAATSGISAALEIVDSRIRDWAITLPDTVADLASCGAVVVAERRVPLPEGGARLIGMVLERNGAVVDTGVGAATLGDPAAAVAWLANTLGPRGVELQPGHVVMAGALHRAVPLERGDVFRAEFDRLGEVELTVV